VVLATPTPIGPLIALSSTHVDLYAVVDVMDDRGWHLTRNTNPIGLHLMLSPAPHDVVDELLANLRVAMDQRTTSLDKPVRYA
jgi:hypothetical protein